MVNTTSGPPGNPGANEPHNITLIGQKYAAIRLAIKSVTFLTGLWIVCDAVTKIELHHAHWLIAVEVVCGTVAGGLVPILASYKLHVSEQRGLREVTDALQQKVIHLQDECLALVNRNHELERRLLDQPNSYETMYDPLRQPTAPTEIKYVEDYNRPPFPGEGMSEGDV